MKSGYIVNKTSASLVRVMEKVENIAKTKPMWARLLSFPVGFGLMLALPLIRIACLVEECICILLNLVGAPVSEHCSWRDAFHAVKRTLRECLGVILVPFIAPFVGIALISSMIVNPYLASKRFVLTCRDRC